MHIATGVDAHRMGLMRRQGVLSRIRELMTHPSAEVRCGCVWVVINLTWNDEVSDVKSRQERAQILRDLGYIESLNIMREDVALDVRERTKTALFQIQSNLP